MQYRMLSFNLRRPATCFVHPSHQIRRLAVVAAGQSNDHCSEINNIAIVGGGLAGLSTAWHLLESSNNPLKITIYDKCKVGAGGASAVAGG